MAEFKNLLICTNSNGIAGSGFTQPNLKVSDALAFSMNRSSDSTYVLPNSSATGTASSPINLATTPFSYGDTSTQYNAEDVKLLGIKSNAYNGSTAYSRDDVLVLDSGNETLEIHAGIIPSNANEITLNREIYYNDRIISAQFTPVLVDTERINYQNDIGTNINPDEILPDSYVGWSAGLGYPDSIAVEYYTTTISNNPTMTIYFVRHGNSMYHSENAHYYLIVLGH